MPTRTLNQTDQIIAHVPVDHFEIVNGPGATKLMQVQEELHRLNRLNRSMADAHSVEVTFTLKTLASNSSFKRSLRLVNLHGIDDDGTLGFAALFSGKIVSGDYEMKTRTGWFSFD